MIFCLYALLQGASAELSETCLNKVNEVFGIFDIDGNHTIDKNEAVNHWKSAFGRISAKEFFNTVDVNHDGEISLEEFQSFWKAVKAAGHTEDEILEELQNIQSGQSWVGFNDLPKKFQSQPSGPAQ